MHIRCDLSNETVNMKYDLIIVTRTTTKELASVTQNCIDSALKDGADVNVIIVETGPAIVPYRGADDYILYDGVFIYNRALNLGLKKAKGDVHILANNDIIFHKGWSEIGDLMLLNKFDSASALSADRRQRHMKRGDWIYEGYIIGTHITGWCIFATKHCIETIGLLNESFEFWFSDNVYADQLGAAGLRHGLFCNIQVDHITSCTLRTMSPAVQRRYSHGATPRYVAMQKMIKYATPKESN